MRKLARLALAVLLTLFLLTALELVCRWTAPKGNSAELVAEGLREYDALLGYHAKPGASINAVKRNDDGVVFDVTYTIDTHGRRDVPCDASAARTQFALFFGDSFVFGQGVADDQTLPSCFAAATREYRAYDYGLPGYGPQHTLTLLETRDLRAEIAEPSGIAIYVFIDAHVRRAIGSMQEVRWQARNAPYYELKGDGSLERLGTFASARPMVTEVYSWLAKSAALRRMNVTMPRLADEHFELVCALLSRSAELALQKLAAKRFVVLLFPGSTFGGRIAPCLAAHGVTCVDYSSWTDPRALARIPGDGHPTAGAYAAVAERLVADLALH